MRSPREASVTGLLGRATRRVREADDSETSPIRRGTVVTLDKLGDGYTFRVRTAAPARRPPV